MHNDIQRIFLPYWEVAGWTDLSYEQIGQCLEANVVSGFNLFDPRFYYGQFTPQGFSARRKHSRMKKASLAPTVSGRYGVRDGAMIVALRVSPHPVFLGLFVLFVVGGSLVWLPSSLLESFKTGDYRLLLGGLFPLAVVYGFGWLIFWLVCQGDLRFWKNLLRVREYSA